ncbi:hypothetical protein RRG54_02670 [Mycoplasmopsis felis]|uniref:hypothetical protein n=1 Tax=Mycoplasmopsis felis TaxID=33923 RepID=UPI00300C0A8D
MSNSLCFLWALVNACSSVFKPLTNSSVVLLVLPFNACVFWITDCKVALNSLYLFFVNVAK